MKRLFEHRIRLLRHRATGKWVLYPHPFKSGWSRWTTQKVVLSDSTLSHTPTKTRLYIFGIYMPFRVEANAFDWGWHWFWGYSEIQIVNDSQHILSVTLDHQHPQVSTLNSGQYEVYNMADHVLYALSYCQDDSMLHYICHTFVVKKGEMVRI